MKYKFDLLEISGWKPAMKGMRNPKRSWKNNDTKIIIHPATSEIELVVGENDHKLALNLAKAGASHRKYLRMINIYYDITACSKFWEEFDTYEYTVENSTSMMHDNFQTPFKLDDFEEDVDYAIFKRVEELRIAYINNQDAKSWRKLILNVPKAYLYTRTVMFNYEVFLAMYFQRKNHKLEEWVKFCEQLRYEIPYMDDIITAIEEFKNKKEV